MFRGAPLTSNWSGQLEALAEPPRMLRCGDPAHALTWLLVPAIGCASHVLLEERCSNPEKCETHVNANPKQAPRKPCSKGPGRRRPKRTRKCAATSA